MDTLIIAQGLNDWHDWVNSGALAAFAVFVCWLVYNVVMHGGKKALELGERYVGSTESLHDTLREAEENRTKLCQQHANGLETMTTSMAASNVHLARLVQIHEEPGGNVNEAIGVIHADHGDMQRMKEAALRACKMCREIADAEIPNSAAQVRQHCDEIERIIQSEAD